MNPAGWYRQTVTIEHVDTSSLGSRGSPVYGVQKVIRAQVQKQLRWVPGPGDEKVQSQYRIATNEPIAPLDRIWLPGTDTTRAEQSRVPLQIQAPADRAGRIIQYVVDL